MAKFNFTAVPLLKLERTPFATCRSLDIMSRDTIRREFEAKTLDEVHQRLDEICAEIAKAGRSWNAWVGPAKGSRAPKGFNAASEAKQFDRDINPDLVTVKAAA